jgi:hypothetical protein
MSGIENENDFSLDFLLNLKNDLLDTLKCVDKEIKRIKKNNNIDSTDSCDSCDCSDSSDSGDCNDSSDNDSNDSEKTLYGPCTDSCCS